MSPFGCEVGSPCVAQRLLAARAAYRRQRFLLEEFLAGGGKWRPLAQFVRGNANMAAGRSCGNSIGVK